MGVRSFSGLEKLSKHDIPTLQCMHYVFVHNSKKYLTRDYLSKDRKPINTFCPSYKIMGNQ